ncbi:Glycine-rich RNA-binding, abscisic acid-inducible protein [Dendrobium catenatum]|uniref:Glycine-rich RNA-binding, abscisic acid-inducible protein n=1 Tax=Dendrobium catenatum TaxID=906689 RepID=A0A2I0X479_9ASPA|nr:Glycine-rich RNA-binding, abscisic acid-inducible protein [Dendrobium catenatum]
MKAFCCTEANLSQTGEQEAGSIETGVGKPLLIARAGKWEERPVERELGKERTHNTLIEAVNHARTHLLPCLAFYCKTIPILSASLPNWRREEIKASLMESEKGMGAATNGDSVDNEVPRNSFMEKHLRSLTETLHEKELVDLLVKLGGGSFLQEVLGAVSGDCHRIVDVDSSNPLPGRCQAAKEIRDSARLYLADHRLAVYGLHEETTSETLCDAFSSYGEIAEGHVMLDSATGKSRRFGFITFKKKNSLQKALEKQGTLVDGRLAFHHQPASERFDGAVATADAEFRRLYVGNIPMDIKQLKCCSVSLQNEFCVLLFSITFVFLCMLPSTGSIFGYFCSTMPGSASCSPLVSGLVNPGSWKLVIIFWDWIFFPLVFASFFGDSKVAGGYRLCLSWFFGCWIDSYELMRICEPSAHFLVAVLEKFGNQVHFNPYVLTWLQGFFGRFLFFPALSFLQEEEAERRL